MNESKIAHACYSSSQAGQSFLRRERWSQYHRHERNSLEYMGSRNYWHDVYYYVSMLVSLWANAGNTEQLMAGIVQIDKTTDILKK